MKKPSHVIWVCPTSQSFYRTKGEVRCRPGSVIPKLVDHDIKINVLIPYDPTLLPKTKLTPGRITRHKIKMGGHHFLDIIKLTRGSVSPGVYMVNVAADEPSISHALLAKAALALAIQLKKPVDVFHLFGWETALVPLFLDLEKDGSSVFKKTHTLLTINSMREQGNYAPTVLNTIGVPIQLYHPEGIEFFGKVSYLKAGLLFADAVGVVDGGLKAKRHLHRNGTSGLEGVLDAQAHKLRRWVSERSLKAHLDAYEELLAMPARQPILPRLIKKSHSDEAEAKRFIESWGPPTPERYGLNAISFLLQSPFKAYAFWEWTQHDYTDYGLVLEDRTSGSKKLLSRGLNALAEFWLPVVPDREYVAELVGWDKTGTMRSLLRSFPLRVPRNVPSSNREATFIDVRTKRRFTKWAEGLEGKFIPGGTSAFEWLPSSSLKETSSSL